MAFWLGFYTYASKKCLNGSMVRQASMDHSLRNHMVAFQVTFCINLKKNA